MNTTHPFHYPFVIKQVGEFITVSVPDMEITVSDTVSHNPKINKDYVTIINALMMKAARKVLEKMARLEDVGKKHYRPASFIRQSIQIQNKDQIPTRLAAKYLGISPATLRRWELAGVISASKTRGGYRKFVLAELDRVKEQMSRGKKPKTSAEQSREELRLVLEKTFRNDFPK